MESIFPEGVIILNMNIPYNKTLKHMKQRLLKHKEKKLTNPQLLLKTFPSVTDKKSRKINIAYLRCE